MTQEQISEKVAEYKAKGCKLPDDKIIAIILKQGKTSKASAAGFGRRDKTAHIQAGSLWGLGQKYATQAEYQRSLLGSDWN